MKEASADRVVMEARKDHPRLLHGTLFILAGVALAFLGLGLDDNPLQRHLEYVESIAFIIGAFLVTVPKGVAKGVAAFGGLAAVGCMGTNSFLLLAVGTLPPALERAAAWSVAVAIVPMAVYVVKTKIVDAPVRRDQVTG